MADAAARQLQYEYKAVSAYFLIQLIILLLSEQLAFDKS